MTTKICSKCKLEKDIVEFYVSKNKPMAICKLCKLTYQKHYTETRKEKIQIYQKEYREKNESKLKVYTKKYIKLHKKEKVEYDAKYKKNKCEINPDYKQQLGIGWYVACVIKFDVLKRDNYECQLCGSKKELKLHHIIPKQIAPNKIEDLNNLITLCKTCHLYKAHMGCYNKYDEVLAEELIAKVRN
jgi:HNH endonuclease